MNCFFKVILAKTELQKNFCNYTVQHNPRLFFFTCVLKKGAKALVLGSRAFFVHVVHSAVIKVSEVLCQPLIYIKNAINKFSESSSFFGSQKK